MTNPFAHDEVVLIKIVQHLKRSLEITGPRAGFAEYNALADKILAAAAQIQALDNKNAEG